MPNEARAPCPELNSILARAEQFEATTVLIDPTPEGARVRSRVDDVLCDAAELNQEQANQVLGNLRAAGGPGQDDRLPFDALITAQRSTGIETWAVTAVPGRHGLRYCLKPYRRPRLVFDLDRLGLDAAQVALLRGTFDQHRPGVVVLAGPYWSGKCTTIYSMLRELRDRNLSVATAEWEFRGELPGINQGLVNTEKGLTLDSWCRTLVRADADVIYLGAIDECTAAAEEAFKTVLTHWRRVFTVLHCHTAISVLPRLMNMWVEPWLAAQGIALVQGQRLLRRLCDRCKVAVMPPQRLLAEFRLDDLGGGHEFCGPSGCEACGGTGFRRMVLAAETYVPSEQFRAAVVERADLRTLSRLATADGMVTMRKRGLLLAARGVTSLEEVLLRTPADES